MKNEKWKMKNEKWKMKNGKWKMENGKGVPGLLEYFSSLSPTRIPIPNISNLRDPQRVRHGEKRKKIPIFKYNKSDVQTIFPEDRTLWYLLPIPPGPPRRPECPIMITEFVSRYLHPRVMCLELTTNSINNALAMTWMHTYMHTLHTLSTEPSPSRPHPSAPFLWLYPPITAQPDNSQNHNLSLHLPIPEFQLQGQIFSHSLRTARPSYCIIRKPPSIYPHETMPAVNLLVILKPNYPITGQSLWT